MRFIESRLSFRIRSEPVSSTRMIYNLLGEKFTYEKGALTADVRQTYKTSRVIHSETVAACAGQA